MNFDVEVAAFLLFSAISGILSDSDPCLTRVDLTDPKRLSSYIPTGNEVIYNDYYTITNNGWYVYPGATMSNFCVDSYHCCTVNTLWVSGTLPTTEIQNMSIIIVRRANLSIEHIYARSTSQSHSGYNDQPNPANNVQTDHVNYIDQPDDVDNVQPHPDYDNDQPDPDDNDQPDIVLTHQPDQRCIDQPDHAYNDAQSNQRYNDQPDHAYHDAQS